MSQPAARLGDATAHGGVVTSGNPTVLINGQPAAAVGDLHVCPLCSPGLHVGGPVMAGAPTVLIGGRPAARVGDACTCAAPAPDVIVSGSPNVLVGGASGAASPGAAAALAAAHGAGVQPGTAGTGATARPLDPWVGAEFTDRAGRPLDGWRYHAQAGSAERSGLVGSSGQVWLDALADSGDVSAGLVGVYGCRWDRDEAREGEAVGMSARCVGIEDGALVLFEVWRMTPRADGGVVREKVAERAGEVQGNRAEPADPFVFTWSGPDASTPARVLGEGAAGVPADDDESPTEGDEPDEGLADRPSLVAGAGEGGQGVDEAVATGEPVYVVEVVAGGVHRATSGPLRFQDWIPIRARTPSGEPLSGVEYRLVTSAGEVRTGTTGSDGTSRENDVPPGPYQVTVLRAPQPAGRPSAAPDR